jgi:hypothetical protein
MKITYFIWRTIEFFLFLMLQIVGAVTTYLVIMIQFQLALPDSNKDATNSAATPATIPVSSE